MKLKYCDCGLWTTKDVPACPRCQGQFSVKEIAAQQVAEFFTLHSLPGHYFESLTPQHGRDKSIVNHDQNSMPHKPCGKVVCFQDIQR